ncbi:MAG: peptidase C14 caspase catalytic subunit p20 [SAR324 cluster bacterium]|nr:peptidase C14 caspase catalytic subunit p20 [SAR324 cluster bacterium]MBL7034901.1 peptidase C14 caspase catalytic subunit p20 [SAR324 cluster bacterium]
MGIFDKVFSSEDSNKEIQSYLDRGKSLLGKNFFDMAAVEFKKALDLDPQVASETITKLFMEMESSGNTDGLLSLGLNVLQIEPDNVELANLIGNAYRRKNDWNHAKNMYQHCLKHDPKYIYAIYNLAASIAKIDIADGQAVSAIAEFENMTDFVLPDIKNGQDKLLDIQNKLTVLSNEEDEGVDVEEKEELIKSTESGDSAESVSEEKVNEEKNNGEGVEGPDTGSNLNHLQIFDFLTADLENEGDEEMKSLYDLGVYCLKNKEAVTAQKVFKHLLLKDKENVDFRCFLVLAIALDDETEKAIKTLQGILGRNPNHRYSNVNIGILFKNKGMIQQSRVSFFITFKLLERSHGSYDLNMCLKKAENLFKNNSIKKALEIYEPLVGEIRSEKLLNRIATLNLERKLRDKAFEIYKRILHINPRNEEARKGVKSIHAAYLLLAENQLKNNDPAKAALLIDKALSISVSKNLLRKAISINLLLENEKRVNQFEQLLKKYEKKEIQKNIQKKIELAEDAEKKADFKGAIRYYQEAVKIFPQHSTLKKLVDYCTRIKRQDQAEKLTNWFYKVQQSLNEKEKKKAQDAFLISSKKEEKLQEDEN